MKEKVDKQLKAIEKHTEYLKNMCRKSNGRMNGVPKTANEIWEQTEIKVASLARDKLGQEEGKIECAQERGKPLIAQSWQGKCKDKDRYPVWP